MEVKNCKTCGKQFLSETDNSYCRICNKKWYEKQEKIREQAENLKWQEQKEQERKLFEAKVQTYKPILMESVNPSAHTLYIIGNGFDLMHRVPSSYYNFRDSLGKNNTIRQMYDLMIGDSYEIILPNHAKSIVIYEHCIFVVMDDLDRNIIFFKRQAKGWTFVSVLESFLHQSLINRRLRHIFLNEDDIIFVYNNRVRKYDLNTGKLIANQQMRDARSKEYLGKDVMNKFVGRGI